MASVVQASDAGQAVKDAQHAQAQVLEEREELAAQRADLEAAKETLAQREADVAARETAATQKEADLVSAQDQITEQQKKLEEQQQQQQQEPQQPGWGGGLLGDSASTCDQLRAQGVQTPIRKGDPYYSRSLDLDRNGVACE